MAANLALPLSLCVASLLLMVLGVYCLDRVKRPVAEFVLILSIFALGMLAWFFLIVAFYAAFFPAVTLF